MKVSMVKAILTEQDVLSALQEYVIVEGLKINNIEIDEFINVSLEYKKGLNLPLKAKIGIGNIHDNVVNIKIMDIRILKLGIAKGIKNFALKKILQDFSENGIVVNGDTIAVDLSMISKLVPYVYFNLNDIKISKGIVEVEVEELVYAKDKETASFGASKNSKKQKEIINDGYTKVRGEIQHKIPQRYHKVAEYAMLVPDIIALLWRLFKDKRISFKTKLLVGGVLGYLISPIDLFPGFIPFIGEIDDIAVAFFGINLILNEIPEEIITQNWQGEEDIIFKIREGVQYISNFVGSKNISKLVDYIKKLGARKKLEEE